MTEEAKVVFLELDTHMHACLDQLPNNLPKHSEFSMIVIVITPSKIKIHIQHMLKLKVTAMISLKPRLSIVKVGVSI